MTMRITRPVLTEIRRQLVAAYPAEGCGLLVGARSDENQVLVRHALPMANERSADGASKNRYLIAPDEYRLAEREAAAAGLEVVGVYHSHPDVAARPSAYDEEHAWPWFGYLIVSVAAEGVRDERVWELTDERRFIERTLEVEEH